MTAIRKRSWIDGKGEQRQAWLVDYRDSARKRRAKQFSRKREAESWATQAAYQVTQGTHTPDSIAVTFRKAADLWIERARRDGLEPTTVAAYDQHVRLHLLPLCGEVRLSQLTMPMIEDYRDQLVDKLTRAMAIRVLRSLTSILAAAQRRGLVAQNVAQTVKVKRMSRHRQKVPIPPKEALRAVLAAAQASDDSQAPPLALLAIFAGLRASELRGLSWRQLDLRTGSVTVDQRADAKGLIGAPKSAASRRTVPLPSTAIRVLKEWKLACPPLRAGAGFPLAGWEGHVAPVHELERGRAGAEGCGGAWHYLARLAARSGLALD